MCSCIECVVDREEPEKCETCDGEGAIDERLGGEWNSNPKAQCPDCDGLCYFVTPNVEFRPRPQGVEPGTEG